MSNFWKKSFWCGYSEDGLDMACTKCRVCKYLDFLDYVEAVAPPDVPYTVSRDKVLDAFIDHVIPQIYLKIKEAKS